MKLKRFVETRQEAWSRLETLLAEAKGRAMRLDPAQIRTLGTLYRKTAADLSVARREFPGDPIVGRLERMAGDARAVVYSRAARRDRLVKFFADTYWSLLADRGRALALSALLFVGSGVFGAVFAGTDPDGAIEAVPPGFLWVVDAESTDTGLDAAGLAGFSTIVLVNNIRVTLLAFAAGLAFGIGTGWVLVQNGYILGVLGGLAVGAGNTDLLIAAIAAHGILELSCIVVGGAAGLAVGKAMLRPGKLTRRQALTAEVPAALRIAAGTAPWLIVAGFVEGYGSRVGLGWQPTLVIGIALGSLYWGLYAWRSRVASEAAQTA